MCHTAALFLIVRGMCKPICDKSQNSRCHYFRFILPDKAIFIDFAFLFPNHSSQVTVLRLISFINYKQWIEMGQWKRDLAYSLVVHLTCTFTCNIYRATLQWIAEITCAGGWRRGTGTKEVAVTPADPYEDYLLFLCGFDSTKPKARTLIGRCLSYSINLCGCHPKIIRNIRAEE